MQKFFVLGIRQQYQVGLPKPHTKQWGFGKPLFVE
jgi:hypothetical protein